MYITRDDAVAVIYDIINNLLDLKNADDREYEENLCEIANCIEHEKDGLHLWGADDEVTGLFIARREDLWTDELKERMEELWNRHAFEPAPYERAEIENDETTGD